MQENLANALETATRYAPSVSPASLPPELDRPFRFIAFDWDGTAVVSRAADAARVVGLLDRLLGLGVRIAIVTGTNFDNVLRQIGNGIGRANARRLYVATNRGSEVFGFDRRGNPIVLYRRVATPNEDRLLDQIAEEAKARLGRLTGLPFDIVYNRLNRRKLDLIPEPAWRDPPKSAIGALLAATEARLRGAGLRHGLREAVELTERLAHELGLPAAKVTSDVKHVEVGLTDKADSMVYLFREIAAPLRITPAEVLILGDEFGPIAGFEGSDHKMLGVSEAYESTIVSVGPEPGGAPARVIHVGGGPDRFGEILEHQLDLEGECGVFATPRDAAWVIEEPGFDLAREHEIESLLAIANGYVGSRGSIAEGTSVSRPATFLAGAFEPSNDVSQVPELVIVPDWSRLEFVIEGEHFSVERGEMMDHRRVLDMRHGVLLREGVGRGTGGHVTRIRTARFASLADRHLFVEGIEVEPKNFSGAIQVSAILSGDVRSSSGAAHWASFEAAANEQGASLWGTTRSGLVAALTSHTQATRPANITAALYRRSTGPTWASERWNFPVHLGEASELYRTVALYTSREVDVPRVVAEATRDQISARPVAELIERHREAWAERWRRADVTIDGAPKIERSLRFALFHLIASANPEDPRCSIGARALSGEAYRGHVFWDTEIFMLPFYMHAYPEAARALLMYRYLTLEGARRKAKKLGYEGALYAWESADTGDETTPSSVITPFGEIMRVLSGDEEHHISADVAYAVAMYGRISGDRSFMQREGLEILVETARFWASRGRLDEAGVYHIDRVIGPDEYHESVNDNAFTNWMARFNLRAAADAAECEGAERLGVGEVEIQRWRRLAAAMYLGHDRQSGLIEQFAGFSLLSYVDLSAFGTRHAPIDLIVGRERTQASQIVKQADVVQLIALLWDEIGAEARRANFLFYEPRTAHGSSLSPGAHAHVAARLGLTETALRYMEQTADIDLGNNMGNAAGGVHAAGMGSLWQAVVLGVGGVRPAPDHEEAILFEPSLLPSWHHLGFPLVWRGRALDVHIEPSAIEVAVEGEAPLPMRVAAPEGAAREVLAEPGRTYAARRCGDGFENWEEISS